VIWYGGSDPGTGGGDPWVSGKHNFINDLIVKSGGINIINDFEGNNPVNLEIIVSEDPDVIICSQSETWPSMTRELILSDPIFSTITAVKENRVYDINADTTERPGPRLVDGLETMQDLILGL
jgi:iron complex transport system substrate-binding protein